MKMESTAPTTDQPKSQKSADYIVVRLIFLRGLGLVYFVAFTSIFIQVLGLIGRNGILPAEAFLQQAAAQVSGMERFFLVPTLFWMNCSDLALRLLTGCGAVLSLLVVCGIASGPLLFCLWFMYLSVVTVGGDFMSFQWDILLLETGFLAIFFAQFRLFDLLWAQQARQMQTIAPPVVVLWLLRFLLFKLMLSSGCVKLLSGDPTWLNFTALDFHYWTQPLPTPVAWCIAQMPNWFQKLSVSVTFFIEIIVPFLIFTTRRLRLIAACLVAFLQIIIALTGNYTFFNLLTILLCMPLLDDAYLLKLVPAKLKTRVGRSVQTAPLKAPHKAVMCCLVSLIILLTVVRPSAGIMVPDPIRSLAFTLSPFHLVNSYGLFAVMTTSRKEIIVEGSDDGHDWQAYEFPFKPGDVKRAPPWVAPYQPRLDWQMWFAALGSSADSPWLTHFMLCLLKGSPEVRALLASVPFSGHTPRFVRATLYDYRFTNFAERNKTGAWWKREYIAPFFPIVTLHETPDADKFSHDKL